VAEQDVLNPVAKRVPEIIPINVKDTVAEQDVLNQVAKRVPKAKPINV
jgi:hypothetical protein